MGLPPLPGLASGRRVGHGSTVQIAGQRRFRQSECATGRGLIGPRRSSNAHLHRRGAHVCDKARRHIRWRQFSAVALRNHRYRFEVRNQPPAERGRHAHGPRHDGPEAASLPSRAPRRDPGHSPDPRARLSACSPSPVHQRQRARSRRQPQARAGRDRRRRHTDWRRPATDQQPLLATGNEPQRVQRALVRFKQCGQDVPS